MIIGLVGAAGAGKNTVADILNKRFGFHLIAFADPIKESLYRIDPFVDIKGCRVQQVIDELGWEQAKRNYPEVRRLLQNMGVSLRQVVSPEIWIKLAYEKIILARPNHKHICLTDLRFKNEIRMLSEFSAMIIKVERPENPHAIEATHISETLAVYTPYVIINDGGLRDLEDKIVNCVETFLKIPNHVKKYPCDGELICINCEKWKALSEFPSSTQTPLGVNGKCKECTKATSTENARWLNRTKEDRRAERARMGKDVEFNRGRRSRLSNYGLTPEQYQELFESQDGKCAICRMPETRVHQASGKVHLLTVDHDHETGIVRGLLCSAHNRAIGALGDSHENIMRVVKYLEPFAK